MNKGHNDAQFYRVDFVDVIMGEMVLERDGERKTSSLDSDDNETKMKELFGGN